MESIKISELISKLTELQKLHGDLDVFYSHDDSYDLHTIKSLKMRGVRVTEGETSDVKGIIELK